MEPMLSARNLLGGGPVGSEVDGMLVSAISTLGRKKRFLGFPGKTVAQRGHSTKDNTHLGNT